MASGLVGKRNLQPRGFTTGQTSCTYRLKYPVAVAASNLKLTFPAWTTQAAGTGDTATGNTVTLGAVYVEYGGTLYPVTFSAASSVAITSGANVTSDAVAGLTVSAGSTLYVRTYVTVTSGGQWPALYGAVIYPDEVSRPGSNLANATGDLTGTGQALGSVYGPVRIFGDVTSPLYAISLAGDSILAGVNDSFSDETQTGYWQRRLYPGTQPYSFVALPGESASQFLTQAASRAALIGDYAQYFVNEYGINDLQGGATLAQLQARNRSIAVTTSGDATLVKRFQQTLGPKSASTDAWATTTNQTTDGINTIRVQYNDWVRAGQPELSGVAVAVGTSGALLAGQAGHPYSGYLEVADLCETARNSGIWKAGYTSDGLHPGPTGNANMAAALDLTPFVDTAAGGGGTTPTGLTYSATGSPAIRSSPFQGAGASQAWASNSFSPPASSLIVVYASATESFNNAWNVPTITDSLATHLTWTRIDTQSNNTFSGVVSTTSAFWALCPTAQTGMTVTVTQSLAGSGQTITFSSVDVRVFTGHDTTAPIGTTAKGAVTAQALAVSLAPAGTGSALLLGASNAAASSAATTAGTGEYVVGETHTGTSFVTAWYGNSSGPTIPSTTQTLDLTGNTAARWQYLAVEVKGAAVATTTTVSTTTATTWAVRSRITATATRTWAVKATITATTPSAWAVRTGVAATFAQLWAARTSVAQGTDVAWSARQSVALTSTQTWAARRTVGQSSATAWAVRTSAGNSYALAWAARTPVAASTSTAWAVAQQVSAASAQVWAIRTPVTASAGTAWAARMLVGTSGGFGTDPWGEGPLGGAYVTTWNVGQAAGTVTSETLARWAVRQKVQAQSAQQWAAFVPVVTTTGQAWAIRTQAGTGTSSTWATRGRVGLTVANSWNVSSALTTVSMSTLEQWAARSLVSSQTSSAWAVRLRVVKGFGTTWSVDGEQPTSQLFILSEDGTWLALSVTRV